MPKRKKTDEEKEEGGVIGQKPWLHEGAAPKLPLQQRTELKTKSTKSGKKRKGGGKNGSQSQWSLKKKKKAVTPSKRTRNCPNFKLLNESK